MTTDSEARTCQGNHAGADGDNCQFKVLASQCCKATCSLCADEATLASDLSLILVVACVGFRLTEFFQRPDSSGDSRL